MHGFLNIDKPAGPTSHDVVARIRKLARQRRVGHAGTLDPAATGVLVVAVGAATRLIEYVQDATIKRYQAIIQLGASTTTDDAAGEVIASSAVPTLDLVTLDHLLEQFRGQIMQIPPIYSALHHEGRRMHELARAGIAPQLPARPVLVERIDLLGWNTPLLTLDIVCGKGTYIRSIARDIGAVIGCGGHLNALRRTAVGTFRIEDAIPLDALESVAEALLPPERAVEDWPTWLLNVEDTKRVRNGLPIRAAAQASDHVRAHAPDGALLALLIRQDDLWKPEKVFDWA